MNKRSQRKRITQYIQEEYGTEPEQLWDKYPNYAVFRHGGSKKWYAAMMDIPRAKLGLPGEEVIDVLNLKCGPLMLGSLLQEKGFFPAYHMSKSNWVSVCLDETVEDDKIFSLIMLSYDSVTPKRKKPRGKTAPS